MRRRRRRRRGGRGRGRGRGRADGEFEAESTGASSASGASGALGAAGTTERAARPERAERPADDEDEDLPVAPRPPRATPFGSVWDSQLGTSSVAPSALTPLTPLPEEEFDDEPEIPEYLIAERNRGRGAPLPGDAVACVAAAPRTSRRLHASDSVAAAGAASTVTGCQRARAQLGERGRYSRRAASRAAWRT